MSHPFSSGKNAMLSGILCLQKVMLTFDSQEDLQFRDEQPGGLAVQASQRGDAGDLVKVQRN